MERWKVGARCLPAMGRTCSPPGRACPDNPPAPLGTHLGAQRRHLSRLLGELVLQLYDTRGQRNVHRLRRRLERDAARAQLPHDARLDLRERRVDGRRLRSGVTPHDGRLLCVKRRLNGVQHSQAGQHDSVGWRRHVAGSVRVRDSDPAVRVTRGRAAGRRGACVYGARGLCAGCVRERARGDRWPLNSTALHRLAVDATQARRAPPRATFVAPIAHRV
jgi:hypothetical protein